MANPGQSGDMLELDPNFLNHETMVEIMKTGKQHRHTCHVRDGSKQDVTELPMGHTVFGSGCCPGCFCYAVSLLVYLAKGVVFYLSSSTKDIVETIRDPFCIRT